MAGVNSLFVRFHFCNLTCSWCDTKYTWHKKSGVYREFTEPDLRTLIAQSEAQHVIFTGGEPTLHPIHKLVVPGKKFHVETNGTIIPANDLLITLNDGTIMQREAMNEAVIAEFNWVVSPKLSNAYQKANTEALQFWAQKTYATFKFVIKSISDINEVDHLVSEYAIDKNKIYIAIEGTTLESQLKPEIVEEIIYRGYNYSPRLHVALWGSTRGK
jgi:organic radical activating enzyme